MRLVDDYERDIMGKQLKDGRLTLDSFRGWKEEYKKAMNFRHIVSILHCGDAVRVVRRIGRLSSSYFLYLDHRPESVIHLGIAKDEGGRWYPESLLVQNKRNADAYIKGQCPVEILSARVERVE